MPGQERRQQLISVAMRLFSKKGFNGTTTKEIAEAAGVNQAILFRHFPTKDELYAAILEHKSNTSRTEKWLEELKVLADRRDDEALFRAVISRTLEHGRRDRDFTRLMLFSALEGHELAQSFRDKRVRPVFNFLCEYIALRQSEKAFRAIEPGVVVRALFGIPTYHSQVLTLFNCRLLSIKDEDAAMSFTRLILDGVCIDSARRNNRKKRSKGTASSTGHTTRHG
jgi:TetR/AcrR family transcriptional regulator